MGEQPSTNGLALVGATFVSIEALCGVKLLGCFHSPEKIQNKKINESVKLIFLQSRRST